MRPPPVIVAGVSDSVTALRVGAYACGLALRQRARLVVVHARTIPAAACLVPDPLGDLWTGGDPCAEVAEVAHRLGLPTEVRTAWGTPADVLTRVAAETRADAVVVGASTGRTRRLRPSVGVRLVRCGRWPVMVVP
ncbi:universal stress protein [Actinoplanes missouriensis]|uniref:universal stress protein n=1 Tax=Actinoplanes missouriensis TaxID=1866 RepID=UPI0033D7A987